MKAVVVALSASVVLMASPARAQSAGSEPILFLVIGPPVALSLVSDLVLLGALVGEGHTPRGRGITTAIFGAVTLGLSALCLALGFMSTSSSVDWKIISALGTSFGAGTVLVGAYAAVNATVERDPDRDVEPALELKPRGPDPSPAQLFLLPFSFKL